MTTVCIRRHHQLPPARIRSDVEWVLAGSGSVSSGSARSRGQLIAAQRLDPRATLSPKGDNSSVAPVKKGNPWTDRKEVVASGVGAQQLAPIDPEKSQDEQRPRFGVSSWTSDLDASQNGISSSQGTFRPLYLRFQSPPDIDNLNNDSVEKGSFSLLPNRLSESTVSSRGSQGVGREKLSQTWPPPSSGCHSPQIPNTSSKRGRRILEPLNTTSPHDGSPHRGVSPARRVSPAHRGTSPTPSAILPMPRGMSPLPVGVNSGVRHKIPPLSPRKKKDWVADSGFGITANGKNDRVVDSTSVKKNRRRKHSTNKGKEIVAIQHNSSPPDEDQAKL
ncbi:hypothetical protein L798_15533 [Zootermopsis nevadensis]|uniref:Uncharacterized protein n=1 Tax=Zootermopsis nevadensis TaxID=136037 RepID=A0A067RTW8_ZOONE|nr:hypothetical protein L798_15533 [Zootermopsis nevadensis]